MTFRWNPHACLLLVFAAASGASAQVATQPAAQATQPFAPAPIAPDRVGVNTAERGPHSAPKSFFYFNDLADGTTPKGRDSRPLGQQFRYTFTGAGRNENAGTMSQWSVGHGDVSWMNVYASGIHQMHGSVTNVYATGDSAWQYAYCNTSGGVSDASGEGAECLAVQQWEDVGDFHGTVKAGSEGMGLSEIHTTETQQPGTEGPRRMLLDVARELYAGHVLAQERWRGSLLNNVTVDTAVTPSPWIGELQVGKPIPPATNLTDPASLSLHFTTVRGTPTEGAHACLAPEWGQPEELVLRKVSVQGSTVSLEIAPLHGILGRGFLFQGACGGFDSEPMRPQANGRRWRDTTYVLGYPDEHHAILGFYGGGSWRPYPAGADQAVCTVRNIRKGSDGIAIASVDSEDCARLASGNTTAVLTGTAHYDGPLASSPMYATSHVGNWEIRWQTADHAARSVPENGLLHFGNQNGVFHIYSMAMADNTCDPAVTVTPTYDRPAPCINGYFHLETNSVAWHSGDEVELPHFMAIRTAAGFFVDQQYSPNFETVPFSIVANGKGVGDAPLLAMLVETRGHDFIGGGGAGVHAPLGIRLEGPNSGVLNALAPQGPNGVAFQLGCPQFNDRPDCLHTAQYYLFNLAGAAGMYSGGIRFTPAINELELFGLGGVQMASVLRLQPAANDGTLHASGDTVFRVDRLAGVAGRIRYLGAEPNPTAHTVATLDDLPIAAVSPAVGGSPLATGACITTAVPMPGITTAMVVVASPANGTDPGDGFLVRALATANDKAALKVCAMVPGTPARTSYNLRAIR